MPLETVVVPLYKFELEPLSVSVPVPDIVRLSGPVPSEMTPLRLVLPAPAIVSVELTLSEMAR